MPLVSARVLSALCACAWFASPAFAGGGAKKAAAPENPYACNDLASCNRVRQWAFDHGEADQLRQLAEVFKTSPDPKARELASQALLNAQAIDVNQKLPPPTYHSLVQQDGRTQATATQQTGNGTAGAGTTVVTPEQTGEQGPSRDPGALNESGTPGGPPMLFTYKPPSPAEKAKADEQAGDSGAADAYAKAVQGYMSAGQAADAERVLLKAQGQNPKDPDVSALLAQARLEQGNFQGAREAALDAKKNGASGAALDMIAGGHAETLASASGRMGKLRGFAAGGDGLGGGGRAGTQPGLSGTPGAGKQPEPAAGAAPATAAGNALPPQSAPAGANQLLNGWSKYRIGDYKAALDEAALALRAKPGDAAALTLKAAAHNRLHEPALAEAAATEALQTQPRSVVALLERGYARYQLGRHKEALVDVESALLLEPLNAMGHLYRGMILEKLDRAKDAVASYLRAGELDPALKPVADASVARLGGALPGGAAKGHGGPMPLGKIALWAAAALLALAFIAKGVKRTVNPEWGTPLTPLR